MRFRNGPNSENLRNTMNSSFKLILEKCIPEELQSFLTCALNPLHLEWTELNRIPKMSKCYWNHYKKMNDVSNFEQLVSNMKLKKLQHKRFVKSIQPELIELSSRYQNAIHTLMSSYNKYIACAESFECILIRCFEGNNLKKPARKFFGVDKVNESAQIWANEINDIYCKSETLGETDLRLIS